MNRVGKVFWLVLGLLGGTSSYAQNLSQHNWYFGNTNKGIRFNRASNLPAIVNNKHALGTGGAAVATDPSNGDLLFYTDGTTIYDATHNTMTSGAGLPGNPAGNQPAVMCSIPGQPGKYFVFVNSANYTTGGTISYVVVDMLQFGNAIFPAPPLGKVVGAPATVTGLTNRSEGMIIIPHSNGTDFWLVTQQNGTSTFSATLIDAASFTGGTFAAAVSSAGPFNTTAANFSYHPQTKKLAMSVQEPNNNAEIFTLNDLTGALVFDRSIPNTGRATTTNQSVYDIEWDSKGQYLYISQAGEAGLNADLLQYDYTNSNPATPTTIITSVLKTPVFRSYGLQKGPDSTLYYLYQASAGGPFLIDGFTKTDTLAAFVVRTATPFGNTDFNGMQFPSFLPKAKVNLTANFTFSNIPNCQNNPVTFFPIITPNADSLRWRFGDGSDTTLWSPVHKYTTAGVLPVLLTAYYQGDSVQVQKTVDITAFKLQLTLPTDTTACRDEFPPPRGNSSPKQFSVTVKAQGASGTTTYLWSNGNAGATLKPDSAGYYYVVATDGTGCSTYKGVNVKEYGKQDQRENIWMFGNKAGIDFNINPPKVLNTSAMNAPEGCAIVCDRNGQTVFYTDGDKLYDKTNTLITSGLGGDPASTQSSLIIPVPGDETLFYIFTTQAINGLSQNLLSYSMFDLKMPAGNQVTVKNIPLFSKSTERITANTKWLIVHEYGNNTFRAYPITGAGIGDPVYSAIGSDHSFQSQQNGEGYMKISSRNELAVALSTPGVSNSIELFHLNDTTGKLSNYRKIDLKQPAGQVYGVEFSSGGNKVYATIKGTPAPSTVYEYMLDSLTRPHFKQQQSFPVEMGAIQLAPNGQIYIAENDASSNGFLGIISPNDDTTKLSGFQQKAFALAAGTTSTLGLPNFRQQLSTGFGGPGFTFSNVCSGDTTRFVGSPTDAIDKFQWFFGDGGSSTQGSPNHLYPALAAGKDSITYRVSLRLTNRCSLDTTIYHNVTIYAPKLPTLPGSAVLCNGPVTLDANITNVKGESYLWTTGDTTKTKVVDRQTIIGVFLTDNHGCRSYEQTIVADNRPQVSLGPDQQICQTPGPTSSFILDAQNPGTTYQWSINGVNGAITRTQIVDTTVPGIFLYKVVVTDPITLCTASSQATYTVKVSPVFTLSKVNPVGCGAANGSVTININASAPAGGPYAYFLSGPVSQSAADVNAPSTIGPIAAGAGTYSVVVTDQISGCNIVQSVGLTDASFTATASPQTLCDPETVKVTVVGAPTYPVNYQATDNSTGLVVSSGTSALSQFNLNGGLHSGTFTIQIKDNSTPGCTYVINNVLITPNPPVSITLTPNLCGATPTISAAGATSYVWSTNVPGSISGPSNGTSIQLTPGSGHVTYTVSATKAGQCPNTQSITVDVRAAISPSFTSSDGCSTTVTLTAAPTGNYRYRWFKEDASGTLQTTGQFGPQALISSSGKYAVEVTDPVSGCAIVQSASQAVQVNGIVTADVTATQACDDGKPFTLTATTNAASPAYSWSLNNSVITGQASSTLTQTAEGAYKVVVSQGSCSASAVIEVIKAPIPIGKLPQNWIICNDPENTDPTTNQVILNPGVFISYEWFKNELSLNDTNPTYLVEGKSSEGLYSVLLTNSFGCSATDETQIRNECLPKLVAPTAFRPASSNAANREFSIFSFFIQPEKFQIYIYNRWGELVFQSADRNFKWNGNLNNAGGPLAGGTYAYVIKYVSSFEPGKGVQEKHGGIVLLR